MEEKEEKYPEINLNDYENFTDSRGYLNRQPSLPPPNPDKNPLNILHSAWIITINSNSAKRRVIKPLREATEFFAEHVGPFLVVRPGGEDPLEIREKHTFERGPHNHKVHAHIYLAVITKGLAFVNTFKMKWFIDKFMRQRLPDYGGCYVNERLSKGFNNAYYITDYLEKGPLNPAELE